MTLTKSSTNFDTPLLQTYPGLFQNRNFLLLWAGYVISALGDRIHFMVMLALVTTLVRDYTQNPLFEAGTKESAQLTIMMLSPFLLFGPITGILADHFPRRTIMLVSDFSRVALVIIARIIFLRERGDVSFHAIYTLLLATEFILATFAAAFSPARLALLPQLVHPDQLMRANSMTNAAGTIASLLGFVIGGALVGHSLNIAMFADAGTFLCSAICLLLMRLPPSARVAAASTKGKSEGVIHELLQGLRYILKHSRVLQVIGLMFLFWCCGTIILNGLTGIVTHHFHLDNSAYGYFMGVVGLGMIIGAAACSLFRSGIPKEVGIAWSMVGVGVFLFLFSFTMHWQTGLILLVPAAAFGAVLMVSLDTLLQRMVPNYVRGRVMGAKDVITTLGLISVAIPLAIWHQNWGDIDMLIRYVLRYLSVGVVGVGIFLVIYYYRRQNLPLGVSIMRRIAYAVLSFWHRYERISACTIPTSGPVIVVANHTAGLDPVTLQISSPRRVIHFMMAKEYYEKWPWIYLYQSFGVIPVNRTGTDIASVRTALRTLSDGKVIGMFPEGGISVTRRLMEGRNGVSVLALRSGATVVPAYIDGTNPHTSIVNDFKKRAHLRIAYGKPLRFDKFKGKEKDKAIQDQVTAEIMAAIKAIRARVAPERDKAEGDLMPNDLGVVNAESPAPAAS